MISIIQGGAISFTVKIQNVTTQDPQSLSGVTAISTCFLKTDGTELMLSLGSGLTIADAALGKVTVALTAAQTALLAETQGSTFQLKITYGTDDPIILQTTNAYQVLQSVC